jgi:hypothetical protein
VRAVLPWNYPTTWPPPWPIVQVPVLPPVWPAVIDPETEQSLRSPSWTMKLTGGEDGIAELDPPSLRQAIRLLAIDPGPSVVAIPDLMLPLAPDEAECPDRRDPEPPLQPTPPVVEPCPATPSPPECAPSSFPAPPPPAVPPLPSPEPPPVSGLPRFGDSVALLQEELLFAISSERGRNADPETGGDRFGLIDPFPGRDPERAIADADELRRRVGSVAVFGATHYPWLRILDPAREGRSTILVPPSGHIAGLMARSTRTGTPASRYANFTVAGATGSERNLSERERALLNDAYVSVIHMMPARGVFAFGARTLSMEPRPDRFVPGSRVVAYIRRVVRALGATLVFEPNDPHLWIRIRLALDAVLYELFRKNALAGLTREDAYRVRCDEATNPPEERALGRVIAVVDVAPALPLEFLTIRIAFSRDEAAIIEDYAVGRGD